MREFYQVINEYVWTTIFLYCAILIIVETIKSKK